MASGPFVDSGSLRRSLGRLKRNIAQTGKEIAAVFEIQDKMLEDPRHVRLDKPVRVVLLGAGHRGMMYADYALQHPREMKVVAVAEPNQSRLSVIQKRHGIAGEYCFSHWQEVFMLPKLADAVIIATPDHLHVQPCMAALDNGYDILLEKPIATNAEDCLRIATKAKETGRIVGICHVLRYSPYFRALKKVITSGAIGEIISVQHLEPVEHIHMSHSYVRGHWRNSQQSTPILIAKSCHDTDIIRWLVNSPATQVQCFGNLKWFTIANAPAGSTERCTDGCLVEHSCPYSALQIYLRDRKRLYVFDLPANRFDWDDYILQELKVSNYGRCVYRMDNDQPDHVTVNMLFESGVTAVFSMEGHVSYHGRRTRIMGSKGDIVGDMERFQVTDFETGRKKSWKLRTDAHGGGDRWLIKDWVQAVAQQNITLLSSAIDVSVDSHLMAFAAERSRLQFTIEKIQPV